MRYCLALLCCVMASQAVASEVSIEPTIDGSGQLIRINNQRVSPIQVSFALTSGPDISFSIGRFAEAEVAMQCLRDSTADLPQLTLDVQGRAKHIAPSSMDLSSGVPAIWISGAVHGRSRLESLVRSGGIGRSLRHLKPASVPRDLNQLRFSRAILADWDELATLEPAQLDAIWRVVASGATLILGVGESDLSLAELQSRLSMRVHSLENSSAELIGELPDATEHRTLTVSSPGRQVFAHAGRALAVEVPWGLGQVRLVGIPLRRLSESPLSLALFHRASDPIGELFDWLAGRRGLSHSTPPVFGGHAWLILALFPLGLFFLRRQPLALVGFSVAWGIIGTTVPAHLDPVEMLAGQRLVLPPQSESVAVGQLQLRVNRGGEQFLKLDKATWSLDDVKSAGVCALTTPGGQFIALSATQGARVRLSYLTAHSGNVVGGVKESEMPGLNSPNQASAVIRRAEKMTSIGLAGQEVGQETFVLDL